MSHKKLNKNTQVRLKELPKEGVQLEFHRETGQLNEILRPLIEDQDYHVQLHIGALDSLYSVKGTIRTQVVLPCSRCSVDGIHHINLEVNELLLTDQTPLGKGEITARVNHMADLSGTGPDVIVLPSSNFQVDEFIHELIALNQPLHPLSKPDCDEACENLLEAYAKGWLTQPGVDAAEFKVKSCPFEVLKKVKLNS